MGSESVVSTHENSDRWLAYELHDGLLQWVVSARMGVESALEEIENDRSNLGARLSGTLTYLENALEEGRELIGFLEDRDTASFDLIAGIAKFIQQVEGEAIACGQKISFSASDSAAYRSAVSNLSPRMTWNLLRVVQQAVRNAIKHAGPCEIDVSCRHLAPESLTLNIRDSGRGFDVEAALQLTNHFGLRSIQHRVKLAGGTLQLQSSVGTGTLISIEIKDVV